MVITAPGLFSTTTFQPSPSDRALAMMRARMSGGVLADAGTTILMTFEGKDCANADPKVAPPQPITAAPAKNSRLFMALPFVCRLPVRDASSECLRLHPPEARVKDYPKRSLWNNIIVVSSHNIWE